MNNKKILHLGISILLFIFNILFVSTFLFIFKISINVWNTILAILITTFEYFILMKKREYDLKDIIKYIIIFLFLIIACNYISGKIYDTSWDGSSYHKVAVGELKNGWNPLYENIEDFNESEENPLVLQNTHSIWDNHYAKGYWIYAANMYKITNNIESGKSILLLSIISTFLISFSFLNDKIKKGYSFILSCLLALNPVMLCQISTYYNDGLLGNFVIMLIIALFMITDSKKEIIFEKYLLYFLILCILINIKFTGFAYAGIYSFVFYMYILISKKQRKNNLKLLTIVTVIGLVVSLGVIGLSTYPKNFVEHGHPFYPLYGKGNVDIMESTTPTELYKMNRFKRFVISNFSYTYNRINYSYRIKVPFTFESSELENFRTPDTRVGGYGVLFGGILILSLAFGIYALFKNYKERKNCTNYLLTIFCMFIVIAILKESWWARYFPQFYLIPILVILMLLNLKKDKITKIAPLLMIIALIFNSYLIANYSLSEIIHQRNVINTTRSIIKNINEDKMLLVDTSSYLNDSTFDGMAYDIYDIHKNMKVIKPDEILDGYTMYSYPNLKIFVKEE